MALPANQYQPDYAVPPGWVLQERLEVNGLSHAEFARRCGRSAKLVSEIIAGKAPIEPETALQFEKVLGVDASIWLGVESAFQLHKARAQEEASASKYANWIRSLPVRELVEIGAVLKPDSEADALAKFLAFFQVGSVEAWQQKYSGVRVAYRRSSKFGSVETALAAWLRLGEQSAEKQPCAGYSASRFKQALTEIRTLTRAPIEEALPKAQELCNAAGVALALVKPLPKTAVSGAAWWRTTSHAVIELSARHKTDDHLWFSMFHEAAHLLLHSKKQVFVDELSGDSASVETEANEWAANMLVPNAHWRKFIGTQVRSEASVRRFADEQGSAPGIVVGMLQHGKHLPWTHLNGLKRRLKWVPTQTA